MNVQYKNDGYVVLRGSIDVGLVQQLGRDFQLKIAHFAEENGLSQQDYLSVINKWTHWNGAVLDIMEHFGTALRKNVAEALGSDVAWPVGATVFRKFTPAANTSDARMTAPTHPHQDISYACFLGSQKFRATTWIPLVLENGDTLALAKGSHKLGIQKVVDFLRRPVEETVLVAPECNDIIDDISLGDCILFDARTWHRSTSMPRSETAPSLRLAIGIQWITPGGLDGCSPGVFSRWPDSDLPELADVAGMRARNIFGMDTAGYFLKNALIKLNERRNLRAPGAAQHVCAGATDESLADGLNASGSSSVSRESQSTYGLAADFSASDDDTVKEILSAAGCDVKKAQDALQFYVLFRKAAWHHYGEAQGTKVFGPLYEYVIKPVLGI